MRFSASLRALCVGLSGLALVVGLGACTTSEDDSTATDPQERAWTSLFDGESLEGWTPKITGQAPGVNKGNTFRVEDGMLTVRYDGYDRFELGVRPGYFEAHAEPVDNAISGTVKVTEPLGDEQIIDVVVDGSSELELTVTAPTTVDVDRNDAIWLTVRDDLVHGFDPDTGRRIAPADMQRRAAVESNQSEAAD